MIHPHTEIRKISDEVGYGVVATRHIPKGTLIWTLCAFDRLFSDAEVAALPATHQALLDHYAFTDIYGNRVLCWDAGRYVNHSCKPAMLPVDYGFEITVRDLQPGEEVTCDYGNLNIIGELNCRCGAPDCRGQVSREDAAGLWQQWDKQMGEALQLAAALPQPLLPYSLNPTVFTDYAQGRKQSPSHGEYYGSPEYLAGKD